MTTQEKIRAVIFVHLEAMCKAFDDFEQKCIGSWGTGTIEEVCTELAKTWADTNCLNMTMLASELRKFVKRYEATTAATPAELKAWQPPTPVIVPNAETLTIKANPSPDEIGERAPGVTMGNDVDLSGWKINLGVACEELRKFREVARRLGVPDTDTIMTPGGFVLHGVTAEEYRKNPESYDPVPCPLVEESFKPLPANAEIKAYLNGETDDPPATSKLTPEEREQIAEKYRIYASWERSQIEARQKQFQPVVDAMFARWYAEYQKNPEAFDPVPVQTEDAPHIREAKE